MGVILHLLQILINRLCHLQLNTLNHSMPLSLPILIGNGQFIFISAHLRYCTRLCQKIYIAPFSGIDGSDIRISIAAAE